MAQRIRNLYGEMQGLKSLSLQEQAQRRDELALKREELAIKKAEAKSRIQKEQADVRGTDMDTMAKKSEATQGILQNIIGTLIPSAEAGEKAPKADSDFKQKTDAQKVKEKTEQFKPPTAEDEQALFGEPPVDNQVPSPETPTDDNQVPSPETPTETKPGVRKDKSYKDLLNEAFGGGLPSKPPVLPKIADIAPPKQSVNMKAWVEEADKVARMTTAFNTEYQKNMGQALSDINAAREMNRRLMSDPPSMQKALGNLSLFKLLTATVHTMKYADIGGGTLADKWIQREFEFLKDSHKAKTEGLKTEQNLLTQYMSILKDQRTAELATLGTLYGVAGEKFKKQLSLAKDEREAQKLSVQIEKLKMARNKANATMAQTHQGQALKNSIEKFKLSMALEGGEEALKREKALLDIGKSKLDITKKQKELGDRLVPFGNVKLDMRPELADKVRKSITDAGKGVRAARRVEGLSKDISLMNNFKAIGARFPDKFFKKLGKKEQRALTIWIRLYGHLQVGRGLSM